jgi:lipopolysaccharide export system protein LptA
MRLKTTFLLLFLIVILPLKGQQNLEEERYVRLIKANTAEMYQNESRNVRRITGPAQFLHNNTLIICDTAIWDVSLNTVDAIGNVKIIQNNTSLSGDRIHYIADSSLAKVRGHIVELMDRDSNRLRTYFLDFNTKDSVAWFYDGGAMIDKDGNIIESNNGYYDSKIERFKFLNNVEMMSDSLVLKSDSLAYYANENRAVFLGQTSIWQNDSYLRAGNGWYERENERYNFEKSVYLLDPKTEVWAERIFYTAPEGKAELYQNVQILDTVQSLLIFSDFAQYSREPAFAKLYNNPSIAFYSVEDNKPDTLFIAADTLLYNSVPRNLADSAIVAQSTKRYEQSKIDPITAMYSKPAPPAGKSENKQENKSEAKTEITSDKPSAQLPSPQQQRRQSTTSRQRSRSAANSSANKIQDSIKLSTDSLKISTDSLKSNTGNHILATDSLKVSTDSLKINIGNHILATDSLKVSTDSLKSNIGNHILATDSLKVSTDTLAVHNLKDTLPAVDSTLIRFIMANKNVRFHRSNLQGKCDSLIFNSIDSIVRMFKEPVMWNDQNQFTSDSIQLVIDNKKLRKVEFLSNAFALAKEDSIHYNQLKGTDIVLHFKEGDLSRVDAFGGVNVLVFIAEDSILTTMNHKECKTLTAIIVDQSLEEAHYRENPKSVLYPIIDLEPAKKRLRGFNLRETERPVDRFAVCDRVIRKSERDQILTVSLPIFGQTSRFFKITPEIPEIIIKTREPKPVEEAKIEAEGVETEVTESEITETEVTNTEITETEVNNSEITEAKTT